MTNIAKIILSSFVVFFVANMLTRDSNLAATAMIFYVSAGILIVFFIELDKGGW